jgi:hypothetical protein
MNPPAPRVIVPTTGRRDMLIAVCCGLGVLCFIVFAVVVMSREQGANSTNQLTGTIVAKHFSGETEKEISVGKKGLKSKLADSGYSFDIKVKPEDRVYEVPVNKGLYDSRKVGDTQSFIRPPTEQR